MKLLFKLVAGIIIGTLIGLFLPVNFVRVLVTVKLIFGGFIDFIIPFIILFFIASGVAGLGKSSGKLLGNTVGLAYISTVIAGLLAFLVASVVLPSLTASTHIVDKGEGLESFVNIEIDPLMGVLTALLMAFVFGIGITKINGLNLKRVFDEGKDIVELVIAKVIIPFLPFYIAGIFAEMAYEGTVFKTLKLFAMVLLLVVLLQWAWLVIQYIAAGLVTKRNPFALLFKMLPAYFTAIGTMSSAATIPVTLQSTKKNGVKENIANFAVPLCATIHLSGSVITIVTCTTAVMLISPELSQPTFGLILPVIFMLGLVMVAAPGVPGGAIMAAIGVLTSMLGFTEATIGLMIALYMAQDSFGTAANVTGDGAISLMMDRFTKGIEPK